MQNLYRFMILKSPTEWHFNCLALVVSHMYKKVLTSQPPTKSQQRPHSSDSLYKWNTSARPRVVGEWKKENKGTLFFSWDYFPPISRD